MDNGISWRLIIYLAILLLFGGNCAYGACYRKPQGAIGDRSPVDENYQIQIDGNPSAYLPGQQYNLSLFCTHGFKFISFTLSLETESNKSLLTSGSAGGERELGHFEIIDYAETKFSTLCENMVESSNNNAKTRVNVAWVAPSAPQSGCVLFKAAILQHRSVWFIDDGFLTKRLCPEEIEEINSQTPTVDPCCACDEAKYEIILERKWRRNTHPKDFPSESWRTKLGEIVGASHSLDYRFWKYGSLASNGLQELGEHGFTNTLEDEIKEHLLTGNIRTIIKAPGIKYRSNVNGKSLATARVGPKHHLISLVLKIDPSPDWILGVAGLELCLGNCTWIEKKVLNLYPWDLGTDAGPSYMSPDQHQYPPDVVRRISSTSPSDYRSPFFDKTGAPMKPLATLHVQKKRTYERECDFEESGALECGTHPWSNWSDCSVKCGPGTQYRTRSYKEVEVAGSFGCKVIMRQNQHCVGNQCGMQQPESTPAECELSQWSDWSECSTKCGKGFKTKTRTFINPYAKLKCQAGVAVKLQQTRPCNGENCGGNIYPPPYDSDNDNNYDSNFGEEEMEPNQFENTHVNSNWFNKSQQDTNRWTWGRGEEQPNYDLPNYNNGNANVGSQNPNSFDTNEDDELVDETNIYGNDKLGGGKFPHFGGRDQMGNTNSFGNTEANFDESRDSRVPNSRNPFHQPHETYGREESGFQKPSLCLEKPLAPSRRCNKKRLIVKNYWFYDADDGECKLFTADNCDVNLNKFLSMEKCFATCAQNSMVENRDAMPTNRDRYNSRGFEVTQQPPYPARWN